MKDLISILFLNVFAGVLLFIIPDKYRTFKALSALMISIVTGYLAIAIYNSENQLLTFRDISIGSTLTLNGQNIIQGRCFHTNKFNSSLLNFINLQFPDCLDKKFVFHSFNLYLLYSSAIHYCLFDFFRFQRDKGSSPVLFSPF